MGRRRTVGGRSRRSLGLVAAALALASLAGCSVATAQPIKTTSTTAKPTVKATATPTASHTSAATLAQAKVALTVLWKTDPTAFGASVGQVKRIDGGFLAPHANADLYFSVDAGAAAVRGTGRAALAAAGGTSVLGFPTGDQHCVSVGCVQDTQHGRLYVPTTGDAVAVPTTKMPQLTTILNFRDVAGDGSGTALTAGGHMARGVVYRSEVLRPSNDADLLVLETLGLTNIIDLRTAGPHVSTPDVAIPGATNTLINLYASSKVESRRGSTAAERIASWAVVSREYVTDPARRQALGEVLRAVLAAKGPVVIHCTAGKDRTGWVSAVLQLLAGASEQDAMASYLASNDYRAADIEARYQKMLAQKGKAYADARRVDAEVDAAYLQASLDEVKQRYGDLSTFLEQGAGLTKAEIKALRAKLTAS